MATLINDAGVEARTLDARELKVGMFGDFAEARGHGKYVKWVLEPLGWKVQPVTVDGVIAVPRPVMIMDWVLRVHASGSNPNERRAAQAQTTRQ